MGASRDPDSGLLHAETKLIRAAGPKPATGPGVCVCAHVGFSTVLSIQEGTKLCVPKDKTLLVSEQSMHSASPGA